MLSEACFVAGDAVPVVLLLRAGVLSVSYSVRGDEEEISALMEKYADVPMSFADACLVRMSEQHRGSEVVTVDSDFLVYRKHGNEAIRVAHP